LSDFPEPEVHLMSDTASSMDDKVIKPTSPDALQERALSLSAERLLSFVDRAELFGITTLLVKGVVKRDEVWKTLLRFNMISEHDQSELLQAVRDDLNEVWMRLDSLASNVTPVALEPLDIHDRPTPRWLIDMMAQLHQELRHSRVFAHEAASLVPDKLLHCIEHDLLMEKYGSPLAIGHSLEALPSGGGIGFGGKGQSIWAADALAQAVLYSINVYDEIMESDSDESKIELGRIKLWWMFLKGFTFSLAHRHMGLQTLPTLVENPAIAERIKEALTEGLKRLSNVEVTPTPVWSGLIGNLNSEVHRMPTPELVELLTERIATTAKEMEDLANFHRHG
jgi:hypothetical protein